jgi:hypothetical protein
MAIFAGSPAVFFLKNGTLVRDRLLDFVSAHKFLDWSIHSKDDFYRCHIWPRL